MKRQNNSLKPRTQHNADAAYYVLGYLEQAFPIHAQKLVEIDGNMVAEPLRDANGALVVSREALALRDAAMMELMTLAPIPSALDQILWAFGDDAVAEVTGRSIRPLKADDGHLFIEKRAASSNSSETQAFLGCVSTLYLKRHPCRVAWKWNVGAGAIQAGRRALHKAGGGRPGLHQRAPPWSLRAVNLMVSIIRAGSGEAGIPEGFPILLDADMAIIEPAFSWLLEYAVLRGRSRAGDTVRTYGEHLYDWFDSLEQSGLDWRKADECVIAAYRNRMLEAPSPHTGRPYARSTINGRVSTVCRFYEWAGTRGLVVASPVRRVEQVTFGIGEEQAGLRRSAVNRLTVRTSERLPRPLRRDELARLFEELDPTARLAAEWALTAGLRRKELCGLSVDLIPDSFTIDPKEQPLVGVPLTITKGGKGRTVYPPLRLIDRTNWYIGEVRGGIVQRARGRRRNYRVPDNLLLNAQGVPLSRERLTAKLATAFAAADIDGTLHWLRHTFAMSMLVRLQIQARSNPDLNPLKVLQVLMGHASITTTAIYLRCVELHGRDLAESLSFLYGEVIPDEG